MMPAFVPEKTAKDYSDFEKFRFEQEFRSIADEYEKKMEPAKKLGTVFSLCAIIGMASAAGGASYAVVFWAAGMFVGLIIVIFTAHDAKLYCPACAQNLVRQLGTFCPGCGGEMKYSWFSNQPKCQVCRLEPRCGKGQKFTIHCCTFCGIKLHEKGI